jgi:hypothetical protein
VQPESMCSLTPASPPFTFLVQMGQDTMFAASVSDILSNTVTMSR